MRTWEAAQHEREHELHENRRVHKAAQRRARTAHTAEAQMRLDTLASFIGNLQQFAAFQEDESIDTITAPGGERYSLWDIRRIYDQRVLLPCDEAVAIEVGLYHSRSDRAQVDRTSSESCVTSAMSLTSLPRVTVHARRPER